MKSLEAAVVSLFPHARRIRIARQLLPLAMLCAGPVFAAPATTIATSREASAATDGTGSADINLEMIATAYGARPGSEIRYDIYLYNRGPDNATALELEIALPAQVEFISGGSPTAFPCTAPVAGGSNTIRCTRPIMFRFASGGVQVRVRVSDSATPGTVLAASAQVSSAQSDPDPQDNAGAWTHRVVTGLERADITVRATGTPDPVAAGGRVTYDVVVTNNGPDPATGTEFFGSIPRGIEWESTKAPPTWRCFTLFPPPIIPTPNDATTVHCFIPVLEPGSEHLYIAWRIPAGTRADFNFFSSVMPVETTDTNYTNNAHTALTRIGLGEGIAVPALAPALLTLLASLFAALGSFYSERIRGSN